MPSPETLRPNGSLAFNISGSARSRTGGSSDDGVLADNNDATYLTFPAAAQNFEIFDFANTALTSTATIKSVTFRARINLASADDGSVFQNFQFYTGGFGASFAPEAVPATSGIETVSFTTRTTDADGNPWTIAALNSMRLYVNHGAGPASLNVYEVYADVAFSTVPGVTGGLGGTITDTNKPPFAWTYTNLDGAPQERFRVRVFSLNQCNVVGFDPNTSTPIVDSGEVFSSATTWPPPVALLSGHAYRAFIQVVAVGSGGAYTAITTAGPWSAARLDVAAPAIPRILSAVGASDPGRATIALVAPDNLLTAAAAVPTSAASFAAVFNCTVAMQGINEMAATCSASALATFTNSDKLIPVVAGHTYSAACIARPITTKRLVNIEIAFYDVSNTLLATATPLVFSENTTHAARIACQNQTAPAGAVHAGIIVNISAPGASELHAFSDFTFVEDSVINLTQDPLGIRDTSGSGLSDYSASYTTSTGPAPVFDFDESYVPFGDQTPTMVIGANGGFKGFTQLLALPASVSTSISIWVKSSVTANFEVACDQITGSTSVTLVAGVLTQVVLTGTTNAIGGSGAATVFFRTPSANVKFWFSDIQIVVVAGSYNAASATCIRTSPWSVGGVAGLETLVLEWSNDQLNWSALRSPPLDTYVAGTNATATVVNYEMPLETSPVYLRARSVSGSTQSSSSNPVTLSNAPLHSVEFWLVCLSDPTLSAAISVEPAFSKTREEDVAVKRPLGREGAVVLHGDLHGEDGTLTIEAISLAELEAVKTLDALQETLLLTEPNGTSTYIDFASPLKWSQTYDTTWDISVDYVETSVPS